MLGGEVGGGGGGGGLKPPPPRYATVISPVSLDTEAQVF